MKRCIADNVYQASTALDQQKEIETYWQAKQGKCLACGIDIATDDQYCPTHAQELSEMLSDLSVRSSADQ